MKKIRMCAFFACCLTLLLALTACGGSSGYEGTWQMEDNGFELQLELGKDGQALYYDPQSGSLHFGSWSETEEGVIVTFDSAMYDFEMTSDGKDALRTWWAAEPFVRTKGLDIPRVTVQYLYYNLWIDAETDSELRFYDDGSWELRDGDSDTIDVGDERGIEIDGYAIILTSRNGKKTELEMSEDGGQITGYDDMIFVQTDISDVLGGDDEDDGGDAVENVGVDPAEFYGCWEYEDYDVWVDILTDGTYQWMNGYEITSGSYTIEEDELVLDSGLRFSLDESGGLIDSDGDALFASELPDSGSDGDESVDEDIFQSFVGYWGYDDYDVWAYIYDDGTCEWYSSNGTSISGSCWMEGEVLRMELEDDTVMEFSLQGDGLVDHEGDTLSWSTVPDNLGENDWDDEEDDWYYEEPAAGNGGFVGCWESVDSDDWLCLYSDGTYEWYSEDGLVSSSTYENYGDEICLDMGADMWFYMGTDGSIYDEEGSWEMFPSQLPDYLR